MVIDESIQGRRSRYEGRNIHVCIVIIPIAPERRTSEAARSMNIVHKSEELALYPLFANRFNKSLAFLMLRYGGFAIRVV